MIVAVVASRTIYIVPTRTQPSTRTGYEATTIKIRNDMQPTKAMLLTEHTHQTYTNLYKANLTLRKAYL